MSLPQPIRIVGIGSPNGDDAVGWEVVRQACGALAGVHPQMEFHCIDGGQRLLDLIDGRGMLVLVDAIRTEETPGTILCLEWPDSRIENWQVGSTHALGPAEALRMAEVLGILPPRVLLYGIVAEDFTPNAALSPAVARAVPQLVQRFCRTGFIPFGTE